jgi:hypothetical protein
MLNETVGGWRLAADGACGTCGGGGGDAGDRLGVRASLMRLC